MGKHVLGKNIFVVLGQETLNEIGLIGTHCILKDTDELVKSTVEQNKDDPSKFRNPECISKTKLVDYLFGSINMLNCDVLISFLKYVVLGLREVVPSKVTLSDFTPSEGYTFESYTFESCTLV